MAFTTLSPALSMSLLGVAYSVFTSALWPCVPFLVERHQTATAYGLLSVALNITLTIVPLIVATIRSTYPTDWNYTLFFFLSLSFLSIVLSGVFLNIDQKAGGILCQPSYTKISSDSEIPEESNPLLDSEAKNENAQDNYIARVISEGIVFPVPRVIIHHHHKINYHSKEEFHYHTTHCKCFQDRQLQNSISITSVKRQAKSIKRFKSPVRRSILEYIPAIKIQEEFSDTSRKSISASI